MYFTDFIQAQRCLSADRAAICTKDKVIRRGGLSRYEKPMLVPLVNHFLATYDYAIKNIQMRSIIFCLT